MAIETSVPSPETASLSGPRRILRPVVSQMADFRKGAEAS